MKVMTRHIGVFGFNAPLENGSAVDGIHGNAVVTIIEILVSSDMICGFDAKQTDDDTYQNVESTPSTRQVIMRYQESQHDAQLLLPIIIILD